MISEPLTHLLIRPGPFERMGIPAVVFGPGSQHVSLEPLLGLPGRPLQVIVFGTVDEDLRLAQPRGVGRRKPRPPPPLTISKVLPRATRHVACPAILDQGDT